MGHVVAELVVVPLGTATPGLSPYVAAVEKALEGFDLKTVLTPMGTVVEGELDEVLRALRAVHEIPFQMGAMRVSTSLKIDERRDRRLSMEGKVKAVREKL
ncbi:MAG: MTH1187 family thiamine-binding protein [Synergistales bacterium]|nr:MTH1187 family thiamine-binding protein [Synergistales bacterium]